MECEDEFKDLAAELDEAREKLLSKASILEIDADITREAAQEVAAKGTNDEETLEWFRKALGSQLERTEQCLQALETLTETCTELEAARKQLVGETAEPCTDSLPQSLIEELAEG